MIKITIIGAGSAFTREITHDILEIPTISGEICLIDIDEKRLDIARQLVEKLIEIKDQVGRWKVSAYTDRSKALPSSDFVINQIEVAGLETVRYEYDIPLKYGVDQCIGDTLGPGGLFKSLRTLPTWLAIVADIEKHCPNTFILNYTNPMSVVTLATIRSTEIPVVGLCHSIQNTSQQLADYIGIPLSELKFEACGINHMSWFTKLEHKGIDMYPRLFKNLEENVDLIKEDPIRLDTMKYLGYFVSESSGHFSEYVPYYRKRKDLIQNYCAVGYNGASGFYADGWPIWRKENDQEIMDFVRTGKINFESEGEYAPIIIDGIVNNSLKIIYGNVLNKRLVENLLPSGVVEVACLVDGNGVRPTRYDKLPAHLAGLCRTNMTYFDLVVESVLQKDKEMAFYALTLDPLSSAVCSLDEIHEMFEELYEAEKKYLPF